MRFPYLLFSIFAKIAELYPREGGPPSSIALALAAPSPPKFKILRTPLFTESLIESLTSGVVRRVRAMNRHEMCLQYRAWRLFEAAPYRPIHIT